MSPSGEWYHAGTLFVVVVVVVVLTVTHRYDSMQSLVTGQAQITLEWHVTSGGKQIKTEGTYWCMIGNKPRRHRPLFGWET